MPRQHRHWCTRLRVPCEKLPVLLSSMEPESSHKKPKIRKGLYIKLERKSTMSVILLFDDFKILIATGTLPVPEIFSNKRYLDVLEYCVGKSN
jgi:hypothetical protein